MIHILHQLGRLWWWIQQGGNSNIILVGITAWYAWLTFRIMRWSAAQIAEQLRPILQLAISRSPVELIEGRYVIENLGERNAKVLDAVVTCYVDGERFSRSRLDNVQGVLIRPQQQMSGTFRISPRLDEFVICTFRVVGSDDGERVFRTYEYWSNVHKVLVSARRPIRVVLRAWMTPIRLPYFKIVRWARHSLMRKLIVLAFVFAVVIGLYMVIRH